MKKIIYLLFFILFASGCATLARGNSGWKKNQYGNYYDYTITKNGKVKTCDVVEMIRVTEVKKKKESSNDALYNRLWFVTNLAYEKTYEKEFKYSFIIDRSVRSSQDFNKKMNEARSIALEKARIAEERLIQHKDSIRTNLISSLKNKQDSITLKKASLVALLAKYEQLCADSLKNIINRQYAQELRTFYSKNGGEKRVKYLNSLLSNIEYNVDRPNSAGGCDVHFHAVNESAKTIKYVYLSVSFKNRVNDFVCSDITNNSVFRLALQGPIMNKENIRSGWENVIYNNWTHSMIINSIQIIYMDGTRTSINKRDVETIETFPQKPVLKFNYLNEVLIRDKKVQRIKQEEDELTEKYWVIQKTINEIRNDIGTTKDVTVSV